MIELTAEELKQHFSDDIFKRISETADELGLECYVVGGYVRDIFLQRPSKDIDVVVVGSGIEMAEALGKRLGRGAHVALFKNFGTAQVKYRGIEVEFVGARKESYQRDSRKPIVEDGTLEDDQNRRDFTINALAVCLNQSRFGELVDPFGGIEDLKEKVKEQHIKEPLECRQLLIDSIREQMDVGETAYEFENRTSVVFVIGVNGVGKTTTIGKLAGKLKDQNKKVILAAADTFRAAAGEQLREWANRAGVEMIGGQEGADPASVVYDAVAAAKARKADVLLCDTAGRLHNKKNLMEELKKINRVIDREYPDAFRETLVVLDATTGQNALAQAKEFNEVTDITGIVLTKMDGTAKGGIAVAIQAELGIPVKYIGVGETIDDLQKFDSEEFVKALFYREEEKNDDIGEI